MRVEEVMTKDVAAVRAETSIRAAVHLMIERRVSGLPVIDDDGVVVGIVSEGDLLRRVELGTEKHSPPWLSFLRGPSRVAADYVRCRTLRVEDVMTRDPDTVDVSATLDDVVTHLVRRRVRRLPVTQAGRLAGIVSRSDLVKALAKVLDQKQDVVREDAAIKADVIAAIDHESWSHSCSVMVQVTQGVVLITGTVFMQGIEAALHVAAERVDGVHGVDVQVMFLAPAAMGV